MCPGSRPATGWMPKRTLTPFLRSLRGQLCDRVLRLGDGHPVARGDHDGRGVLEQLGDLGGVRLAVLAVVLVLAGADLLAEAAGDDRDERAVHRLAHDVAEDRTGGADEGAGDDEQVVAEHEAGRGGRPPGVAVEHRDDDRHVAAADRGDQVPAERQRDRRHDAAAARPSARRRTTRAGRRRRRSAARLSQCRAGSISGEDLMRALQLEEGDDRAGERHRTDEDAEEDLDVVDRGQRTRQAAGAR